MGQTQLFLILFAATTVAAAAAIDVLCGWPAPRIHSPLKGSSSGDLLQQVRSVGCVCGPAERLAPVHSSRSPVERMHFVRPRSRRRRLSGISKW